jgi:hypothetical protein
MRVVVVVAAVLMVTVVLLLMITMIVADKYQSECFLGSPTLSLHSFSFLLFVNC